MPFGCQFTLIVMLLYIEIAILPTAKIVYIFQRSQTFRNQFPGSLFPIIVINAKKYQTELLKRILEQDFRQKRNTIKTKQITKDLLRQQTQYRHIVSLLLNRFFCKIKYQNITYQVGEYVQLFTLNQAETYVAKLTKVVKTPNLKRPNTFIEVQWVLKKSDLPDNLLNLYGEYISAAEVFPSKEKLYLYVESIKNKCTILCIEEYGQLGLTNESIFYTRSNYNEKLKILTPDPSTWSSDCDCNKPTNPDLQYVECSKCRKWFHSDCVQSNIINGIFLCSKCFGTNNSKSMIQEE